MPNYTRFTLRHDNHEIEKQAIRKRVIRDIQDRPFIGRDTAPTVGVVESLIGRPGIAEHNSRRGDVWRYKNNGPRVPIRIHVIDDRGSVEDCSHAAERSGPRSKAARRVDL